MSSPPAAIHCDLDGARHIYRYHGWVWRDEQNDPLWDSGLDNLLDFLDRNELRATLFAIAGDVDNAGRLARLRGAVERGHEIASHGLSHALLAPLDLKGKRREIEDSKKRLEDALGVAIRGFRAPAFSIDRDVMRLLADCGYAWDSSVFPTRQFAERLGVTSIAPWPNRPLGDRGVLELPLPAYRPAPLPFHPCYSLLLGYSYFRWCLGRFRRLGAPLVLLFHLTDFADPLPHEQLAGIKSRWMTLSNLTAEQKATRCHRMLEAVRRNYRIVETRTLAG